MPREVEGFRDQLEMFENKFPDRVAISLEEAITILDTSRKTLMKDKTFPMRKTGGKWIVALVPLARWLCHTS